MKKTTCTFSYGGPAIQCARLFFFFFFFFFHSYLKETKKVNNQFLNEHFICFIYFLFHLEHLNGHLLQNVLHCVCINMKKKKKKILFKYKLNKKQMSCL